MDEISSQILSQLKADGKLNAVNGYTGMYDNIMGFYHAISWKEDKWIFGLLSVYVLLLTLVVLTRNYANVQMVIMILISALVYNSETVNVYGHIYWQRFSSQNYFDESGIFIGIFYSVPLLLILLWQLIQTVWISAMLLIDVKRKEIKENMKSKQKVGDTKKTK